MPKSQQPEFARTRRGSTDADGPEMRARELGTEMPAQERATGPVPEENKPGHHPDREQDKPAGPSR